MIKLSNGKSIHFLITGALIRMLGQTGSDTQFLAFSHIGSILNGIAGTVVMAVPPALSATWFPPNQRTIATCIAQVFTQVGTGLSFAIGPILVTMDDSADNHTPQLVSFNCNVSLMVMQNDTKCLVKYRIGNYLVMEVIPALIVFLFIVISFKDKPDKPPCPSATVQRTHYREGLRSLAKDTNAWLCALAYAMSGGTFLGWQVRLRMSHVQISEYRVTQIKVSDFKWLLL